MSQSDVRFGSGRGSTVRSGHAPDPGEMRGPASRTVESFGSRKERQQIVSREPTRVIGIAQRNVGERALLRLQREDAFLDGVLGGA